MKEEEKKFEFTGPEADASNVTGTHRAPGTTQVKQCIWEWAGSYCRRRDRKDDVSID